VGLCILTQIGTLIRPASVIDRSRTPVPRNGAGRSLEEADLWRRSGQRGFQSQHTNVDALAGFTRSQVTLSCPRPWILADM
jgi:hypothetical protein